MEITKVHCLFEQSGTFKREFMNLGITAEDYDILDDFGETDNRRDLFAEIEKAYAGEPSMFDDIEKTDLILAFFPCTRFEAIIPLQFRGEGIQQKNWSDAKKLEYSLKLHGELSRLYSLICKLFAVCLRGGVQADSRKPIHAAALPDRVFSGKAETHYKGPDSGRRLLQETDAVLVRELRAGAKLPV